MTGKRIYLNDFGHLILGPGDYGKDADGVWWAVVPEAGYPMGMLTDHQVVEHGDGTITVSPSILIEGHGGKTWHGYLTDGVWAQVEF